MGKGDTYRPVNQKKYEENWLRLYGVPCPKCAIGKGGLRAGPCSLCQDQGLVEPRIAEKYEK
jgi:hypothetical protein